MIDVDEPLLSYVRTTGVIGVNNCTNRVEVYSMRNLTFTITHINVMCLADDFDQRKQSRLCK